MIIGSVLHTNIIYYSILGLTIIPIFTFLAAFLFILYIEFEVAAGRALIIAKKYNALLNVILFFTGSSVVIFNFLIGINFEKVIYPAADMYQKEEEEEIVLYTQVLISRKKPTIDESIALKPTSIKLIDLPSVSLEDVRFAEEHFGVK